MNREEEMKAKEMGKENAEAAKPKTKAESKSKTGGYTGVQVLKGLEKADRLTSQEAFTKEVDKYRGSVNRAVSHIENQIAGLYEGKYTALDKIKKLESDLSKANERSARAYGRRAAKLRSVDNPYGLTGDGRDGNRSKTREKIRSLDSEVTQARSRVNRIDNQIGKLQNQLSRLNDIYGIENPVAVIQRAAGRGYDKKYPD
jgi:chromosome segregation ATPase